MSYDKKDSHSSFDEPNKNQQTGQLSLEEIKKNLGEKYNENTFFAQNIQDDIESTLQIEKIQTDDDTFSATMDLSAVQTEIGAATTATTDDIDAMTTLNHVGRLPYAQGQQKPLSFIKKIFNKLGQFFYFIGFATECHVVEIARFIRDIVVFLFQFLLWFLSGIAVHLSVFFRSVISDITFPFKRFGDGFYNKNEQKYTASPADVAHEAVSKTDKKIKKAYKEVASHLTQYLLPLITFIVMAVIVWAISHKTFVLAVQVNGNFLGYVENEKVIDDAKNLVRKRLVLGNEQNIEGWNMDIDLSIRTSDKSNLLSVTTLADSYVENSSEEIVPGTGLFIDDTLVAATTHGEELQQDLDNLLAQYSTTEDNQRVEFSKPYYVEEGIYYRSGMYINNYNELHDLINSVTSPAVYYTSTANQTLSDIAVANNLQVATLQNLNPSFAARTETYRPGAGTTFLVVQEEKFMPVQVITSLEYVQNTPFDVTEELSADLIKGDEQVIQEGEMGQELVQAERIYIDGIMQQTNILNVTKVKDSVPEVKMVGTSESTSALGVPGKVYENYIWPLATYKRRERGVADGHRGIDISAALGTPIMASNGGVVTVAAVHSSYGNYVVIDHGGGIKTLYAHASQLLVTPGQVVSRGQTIALVGSTGNSTGPHLHMEVQVNNQYIDLEAAGYIKEPVR